MPRNLSATAVDAFRARLCAVAEQRFARSGVEGVTMRQLADALGCSPMTPYRYFRDKDEILAAVRTAAFDRFAHALEEARRQARGDLRAGGQAVGEAYVRFALDNPEAYRLMFDLSQPHPDRYPEGDAQLLGYVFWATLHGLVVLHLAGRLPETPDFRTIQQEAVRLLVAGARSGMAGPPPPAAPRRRAR